MVYAAGEEEHTMDREPPVKPWLLGLRGYPAPGEAEAMLDLNESPWPPPDSVVEAVAEAAREANRYPRRRLVEAAVEAVARYAGVDPGMIVLGLGGDMVIEKAFQATVSPGDTVAGPQPCFSMYRFYTSASGARWVGVELEPEGEEWRLPWDRFLDAVKNREPRLVALDNPNNPGGGLLVPGEDELGELLELAGRIGALVVLDEAYYEFSRVTYAGLAEAYPNLLVVRTLSKAFALAGLRVGYGIAHPRLASALRAITPPFLPRTSLAAAAAALRDPGYALRYAEAVVREREWLRRRLSMLGLRTYRTYTNFVVAEAPRGMGERLAEKGIAVKEFEMPRGVNVLRVSAGSPRENSRLVEALWLLLRGGG